MNAAVRRSAPKGTVVDNWYLRGVKHGIAPEYKHIYTLPATPPEVLTNMREKGHSHFAKTPGISGPGGAAPALPWNGAMPAPPPLLGPLPAGATLGVVREPGPLGERRGPAMAPTPGDAK